MKKSISILCSTVMFGLIVQTNVFALPKSEEVKEAQEIQLDQELKVLERQYLKKKENLKRKHAKQLQTLEKRYQKKMNAVINRIYENEDLEEVKINETIKKVFRRERIRGKNKIEGAISEVFP